jgi:hypothetical protein
MNQSSIFVPVRFPSAAKNIEKNGRIETLKASYLSIRIHLQSQVGFDQSCDISVAALFFFFQKNKSSAVRPM